MNEYTAVVRRDGRWWIGWLEEIPGVSSQGESREELMGNLRSALAEALEMNRSDDVRRLRGEGDEIGVILVNGWLERLAFSS